MSDGPYKSLPMPNTWKKVAELAENEVNEISDVLDALTRALEADWQKEVGRKFMECIKKELNQWMFPELTINHLEKHRQLAATSPMRNDFLDTSISIIEDGSTGDDALSKAVSGTLKICCHSHSRQIEEHYLHKAGHQGLQVIRGRMSEMAERASFSGMADRILENRSAKMLEGYNVEDGPGI